MSEVISDLRKKNMSASAGNFCLDRIRCIVNINCVLCNELGAVRHTRLARTACIYLQHGNIPVGRNNNNLFLAHYIKKSQCSYRIKIYKYNKK